MRLVLCANCCPHSSQKYFFSPVWVGWWFSRFAFVLKLAPQDLQTNGLKKITKSTKINRPNKNLKINFWITTHSYIYFYKILYYTMFWLYSHVYSDHTLLLILRLKWRSNKVHCPSAQAEASYIIPRHGQRKSNTYGTAAMTFKITLILSIVISLWPHLKFCSIRKRQWPILWARVWKIGMYSLNLHHRWVTNSDDNSG